jgi:hypothetical protein
MPGAAGPEHYQRVVYECRLGTVSEDEQVSTANRDWNSLLTDKDFYVGECFEEMPVGGGSPVKLSLRMVFRAMGRGPEEWELDFMERSTGSYEALVAGTILTMNSMSGDLKTATLGMQLQKMPLAGWMAHLKPLMDLSRRMGMWGEIKGPQVRQLRKLTTVMGRSLTEADWELEKKHREWSLNIKVGWKKDSPWPSAGAWAEQYAQAVDDIVDHVVTSVSAYPRHDLDEWWKRRHHWMPGGSSSMRRVADDSIRADPRRVAQTRPDKKVVAEHLGLDHPWTVLSSVPVMFARTSTKHEVGEKNRALYAQDDNASLVESFCSVHIEKELHYKGIIGSESVADMQDWVNRCLNHNYGYWQSMDYSDFNAEERTEEMCYLDASFARAWWLRRKRGCAYEQKALASLWVSKAQMIRFATGKSGDYRVFTGLWSGTRNTARNNSINHGAYKEAAIMSLRNQGYPSDIKAMYIFGDDEDAHHPDVLHAHVHVAIHTLQQHALNPTKQIAGREDHEFLQVAAIPGELPKRPLPKIIAGLATGNWYVETGVWYENVVNSCSDNWWEAVARGVPLKWAQRLAIMYLDALMRVPPDEVEGRAEWIELEWWTFRHGNMEQHPLWRNSIGVREETPKLVDEVKPNKSWETKATGAWLERMAIFKKMVRPNRWAMYERCLIEDSYKKTFHHYRQREMQRKAVMGWPRRTNKVYDLGVNDMYKYVPTRNDVKMMVVGKLAPRRPQTEEEIAARLGVDAQIFDMVQDWKALLRVVKPWDFAKWTRPAAKLLPGPLLQWLEKSLCAAVMCKEGPEQLERIPPWTRARRRTPLIIWAGNGAGKTWFTFQHKQIADYDAVMYAAVGWERVTDYVRWEWSGRYKSYALAAYYQFMVAGKQGIMTQHDPVLLRDWLEALGCTCQMVVVNIEEQTRRDRLSRREGWTANDVEQKLADNRRARENAIKAGAVVVSDWVSLEELVGGDMETW